MSTKSETLFEAFLTSNGVTFSRIEEVKEMGAKRPDYLVEIGDLKIMFEVKQLGDDEDDKDAQLTGEWSSTPGAQVRQRISRSKKQIQFAGNQGIASVLLIYNNLDPLFQLRGTDDLDFRTAMYGELGCSSTSGRGRRATFSMAGRARCRNRKTRRSAQLAICATEAEKQP